MKAFYWMRLYQLTARFIRIISQTLRDIIGFTVLLFVAIFMFANIIYMLHKIRGQVKLIAGVDPPANGQYEEH